MNRKEKIEKERELIVAKRNDMLQKARFNLTVQEQKIILYAVAQIKPDDTYMKEYTLEIKDFFEIMGWDKESYTDFKKMLKALADKSWTIPVIKDGEIWDSVVRWFTTARSNKKSGKVVVKFHEDMMPYLLELSKQYDLTGQTYTQYKLKYILAMQSKYSPRLYELLKSYDNKTTWFFQIEDLHKLLSDCDKEGNPLIPTGWKNFAIFKRDVLEPAVKEINKYTDMKIVYKTETKGRGGKVVKIHFLLLGKTKGQLIETDQAIRDELDGQINIFDVAKEMEEAPDPFDLAKQEQLAVIKAERAAEAEAERRRQEAMQGIGDWIDPK